MVGKRRLRIQDSKHTGPLVHTAAPQHCPLCGRMLIPGPTVDEHHLVPKSKGGTAKTLIHKICHQKIHSLLSETTLAREYFTWEALKAHPELEKFIEWVQKRPADYVDKNRRAHSKR